jgi:hypothetical protein
VVVVAARYEGAHLLDSGASLHHVDEGFLCPPNDRRTYAKASGYSLGNIERPTTPVVRIANRHSDCHLRRSGNRARFNQMNVITRKPHIGARFSNLTSPLCDGRTRIQTSSFLSKTVP